MTITLIDEARYDAEMDETVLPALRNCMAEGWMEPATVDWDGNMLPKLEHSGRLHYYCYDAHKFDALREDGASGVFRGAVVISHGFTEFGRKYITRSHISARLFLTRLIDSSVCRMDFRYLMFLLQSAVYGASRSDGKASRRGCPIRRRTALRPVLRLSFFLSPQSFGSGLFQALAAQRYRISRTGRSRSSAWPLSRGSETSAGSGRTRRARPCRRMRYGR